MDFSKLKEPKNKKILAEEVSSPPSKAKLTDQIMLKVTPEEKQKITGLAGQMGLKMSPYIRYILIKHEYI